MEIPIDEIKIGRRFRKKLGDINSLAQSIQNIGLLHPVVITPETQLIAGYRRLKACQSLNWQTVPVRIVDLDNIIRGQFDENVQREPFRPSEAVAIAKALEPKLAVPKGRPSKVDEGINEENFLIFEKDINGRAPQTRDKVASCLGISGRTLEKAKAVVEAAEEEPEKFAPLVEEMDRTQRVSGAYRKLKIQQEAEKIAQEPPPLPSGPFRVIVADPPWHYEKRASDPSHRAGLPYPSMTLDEIKAMPVRDFAADNAILWLWTTNAHLQEAFEVVESWGFEYKTLLTWVKNQMGTGDWLRGQTEHCLVAIRGKPTIVLTNQTTVLHAPRRDHSRKPDEFYTMIEILCPGSKVELFARSPRQGWIVHGSEFRFSNKPA